MHLPCISAISPRCLRYVSATSTLYPPSPPPCICAVYLRCIPVSFCEEKLEDLNMEPGEAQMDLVMFGDALSHVCRIKRIIAMPR